TVSLPEKVSVDVQQEHEDEGIGCETDPSTAFVVSLRTGKVVQIHATPGANFTIAAQLTTQSCPCIRVCSISCHHALGAFKPLHSKFARFARAGHHKMSALRPIQTPRRIGPVQPHLDRVRGLPALLPPDSRTDWHHLQECERDRLS